MKIKSYKNLGHGIRELGVYLSNNEYKELRAAGIDCCSEEILNAYYPLKVAEGYGFKLETKNGQLTGFIKSKDIEFEGDDLIHEVVVKIETGLELKIKTSRRPKPAALTKAIIRRLMKNGEIHKNLYK